MKKQLLFAILCTGFILLGIGSLSNVNAQTKIKRGAMVPKLANSSKPAPPDSKLLALKQIVRARKSGNLPAGDPCTTALPITLNQSTDGALASGDCVNPNDGTLLDFYDYQGTAGQAISVSMISGAFDTYLYLLDDAGNVIDQNDDTGNSTDSRIPIDGGVITLPYTGDFIIGANSYSPATGAYTISVNTDSACTVTPIIYNQTVNGTLAASDCPVNIHDQPFYTDLYTFNGVAGQQISIAMSSTAIDAFLILHTPSGAGSLRDDDSGGGTNARIPATGTFTLPETGNYTIEATSYGPAEIGNYTLNVVGPVSQPVTVSGRVLTPDGRGLRNATVSITDSLGVNRTATTSSFGFFSFDNVSTGGSYTFRISSRLYRFTSRTVQVNDNLTLADFVGLE